MIVRIGLIGAISAILVSPALALTAIDSTAPVIERKLPEGPPSMMSNAEIAAHNKELDSRHPDFIRCRKLDMIGSLVKKARVCRTNEQWAASWQKGNQNVRDTAEAFAPKFQDCRNSGGC